MKIPLYNRQVQEVAGYQAVNTPLLQSAPVSTSAGVSKILSKALDKTANAMARYTEKVDNQLKQNEVDKLALDYDKKLLEVQQTSQTSDELSKGYADLNKEFEGIVSKSKFPQAGNHKLSQLKLYSQHQINTSVFKMKNQEARQGLDAVIQGFITSNDDKETKLQNIEKATSEAVANGTIDNKTKNEYLLSSHKNIDLSVLYKMQLAEPQIFSEDPEMYKEFPNLTKVFVERRQSETRTRLKREDAVKKAEIKDRQAKVYTSSVKDLILAKGADQVKIANNYLNDIDNMDMSPKYKNSLITMSNNIIKAYKPTEIKVDTATDVKNEVIFNNKWIKSKLNGLDIKEEKDLYDTNNKMFANNQISKTTYLNNYKLFANKISSQNLQIVAKTFSSIDKLIQDASISNETASTVKSFLNGLLKYDTPIKQENITSALNGLQDAVSNDKNIKGYMYTFFDKNKKNILPLLTKEQIKANIKKDIIKKADYVAKHFPKNMKGKQ